MTSSDASCHPIRILTLLCTAIGFVLSEGYMEELSQIPGSFFLLQPGVFKCHTHKRGWIWPVICKAWTWNGSWCCSFQSVHCCSSCSNLCISVLQVLIFDRVAPKYLKLDTSSSNLFIYGDTSVSLDFCIEFHSVCANSLSLSSKKIEEIGFVFSIFFFLFISVQILNNLSISNLCLIYYYFSVNSTYLTGLTKIFKKCLLFSPTFFCSFHFIFLLLFFSFYWFLLEIYKA